MSKRREVRTEALRLREARRWQDWENRLRSLLVITLMLAFLPGCALLKPSQAKQRRAAAKKKAAQTPKAEQLIGTIALVSVDGNFVLIDSESRPSPAMGTLVRSRPAGATPAEMRVTEIRKRPFVIADIVSGTPQKGDPVFQ